MATITHMRRVFIHRTTDYWYLVPIEMKEEFYLLLNKFFDNKTKENKEAFLNKFQVYQWTEDLPTVELYVKEQGLYDKRRDKA